MYAQIIWKLQFGFSSTAHKMLCFTCTPAKQRGRNLACSVSWRGFQATWRIGTDSQCRCQTSAGRWDWKDLRRCSCLPFSLLQNSLLADLPCRVLDRDLYVFLQALGSLCQRRSSLCSSWSDWVLSSPHYPAYCPLLRLAVTVTFYVSNLFNLSLSTYCKM